METYSPIVCYHQHSRTSLAQPIAGIYYNSALSVGIAGASSLVNSRLLPPARLELDSNFDRRTVVEGADGMTLFICHRDFVRVDGVEGSK